MVHSEEEEYSNKKNQNELLETARPLVISNQTEFHENFNE